MNGEFSLEEKIDCDDAWITFHQALFEDESPQDVLDPDGGIRKTNPTEEWGNCFDGNELARRRSPQLDNLAS